MTNWGTLYCKRLYTPEHLHALFPCNYAAAGRQDLTGISTNIWTCMTDTPLCLMWLYRACTCYCADEAWSERDTERLLANTRRIFHKLLGKTNDKRQIPSYKNLDYLTFGYLTQIGTSSIDWDQLSRFYLKMETESSLRNVVFWNINRTVFLIKTAWLIKFRNIIIVLMYHHHKLLDLIINFKILPCTHGL
jgi:hypothetical protein